MPRYANYCTKCGTPLVRGKCPRCGKALTREERFQAGRVSSSWDNFRGQKIPTHREMDELERYGVPFDVDPEIREMVMDVNRRGYYTGGSCAGHPFPTLNTLGRGHLIIKGKRKGGRIVESVNLPLHEQDEVKRIMRSHGLRGAQVDPWQGYDMEGQKFGTVFVFEPVGKREADLTDEARKQIFKFGVR